MLPPLHLESCTTLGTSRNLLLLLGGDRIWSRRTRVTATSTVFLRSCCGGGGRRRKVQKTYLGRTDGGLEGGQAVVEGTQNGDHGVCDGLALPQTLPHELRPCYHRIDFSRGCPHPRCCSFCFSSACETPFLLGLCCLFFFPVSCGSSPLSFSVCLSLEIITSTANRFQRPETNKSSLQNSLPTSQTRQQQHFSTASFCLVQHSSFLY